MKFKNRCLFYTLLCFAIHLLLLYGKFQQSTSLLPGNSTFENELFQVQVNGGFIQQVSKTTILIRASQLEPIIKLVAKEENQFTLLIANIHPDRSSVELTDWKIDKTTFRGTLSFPLKKAESKTIAIKFRYPKKNETVRFLIASDIEDGYATLLKFKNKAIREDPLFLFLLGDVVDKGRKFRYQMHQEFFDTFPFPVFSLLGDGDLDDFSAAKKLHLYKRKTLFRQFYGEPERIFKVNNWLELVLLDNVHTTLESIDRYQKKCATSSLGKTPRMVLAHVPPIDPRPLPEKSKKGITPLETRDKFLEFLASEKIEVGFYGHLHHYFDSSIKNHRMLVPWGLGARPFSKAKYSYFQILFQAEANPEIEINSKEFASGILLKYLNKYGFYWWGWWYLLWWDWKWRLLQLLVFFSYFSIIGKITLQKILRKAKDV